MFILPEEQGNCKADAMQQSLLPKTGDCAVAYSNQGTIDNPQRSFDSTTKVLPILAVIESVPLLRTHERADTSEGQRSSDIDEVPGAAYMNQIHVDEPGTKSSETLQDNSLVAQGNISTSPQEKEAETPLMPPLENEAGIKEESGAGPVTQITHQVQEAISVGAAPSSTHEIVEGSKEKASDLNTDPQKTSSQQAPQCTDKVNEVLIIDSQINQADDHYSSSVEFSSPLLYDKSSPGTQVESLQSSSPTPVPSSPFTSNPTPPSSVPSSPLVHGAADAADPLVALYRLPRPNNLQSSSDNHVSRQQLQTMEDPGNATSGTNLEQGHKVQIVRSALPNPRRPTAISQRKQHEKLSKPFRPPALIATKHNPTDDMDKDDSQKAAVMQYTTPPRRVLKSSPAAETENRSKNKTPGAAIQFKSPLISRNALEVDSSIRLTPTIQMLERKLQILKRAIKVKEDNQEDQLRGLITKWTEAGREVAWELWEIVGNSADGAHGEFTTIGGKRMYQESWGWEMGSDKRFKEGEDKKPHSEDANNGEEQSDTMERVDLIKGSDEDEDLDRPHDTLGTMLRQLGIDPQTLSWNDEEGAFKEVTDET